MAPQVAIGGWNLQFQIMRRFGGTSGLVTKTVASGYSAVSGITITNSGAGTFNVALDSVNTSGMDYGNYAYTVERLDSGHRTVVSEGYLELMPSM